MIELIPDYIYAFALPLMIISGSFILFVAYGLYHQAIKDWYADCNFFDFILSYVFGEEYTESDDNEQWG